MADRLCPTSPPLWVGGHGFTRSTTRLRRRYIRWYGKTWRLFYAAIEEGWQTGLPDFVRAEFAGYLDCSVMQRGFAHLACEDCGLPRLVAFTCAGRGFCPTCLGRRMNQTTHNLLAHVLPAAPLRQRVLSLPYALRAPLAYEPGLMGVVARVFADSLLRWYGRRLAPNNGTSQGGLLTVIQRSSGDMRLNPHLHVVALDGLYVAGPDGQPVFRALGHLKTDEVADVVQVVKIRVLKALLSQRCGAGQSRRSGGGRRPRGSRPGARAIGDSRRCWVAARGPGRAQARARGSGRTWWA